MFDIKTPRRVYYLAAEDEDDMNSWVDLVCRVCGLHNFTAESGEGEKQEAGREAGSVHGIAVVLGGHVTSAGGLVPARLVMASVAVPRRNYRVLDLQYQSQCWGTYGCGCDNIFWKCSGSLRTSRRLFDTNELLWT